jgi:predicted MPP superfamily phosphohydrolase
MAPMSLLGDKPFHTFLLLTEKPARWAAWQIAPVPIILATSAGLFWARAAGEPAWGWAVFTCLLFFALVDWALFASLPRLGLSFGPVQPPWLSLAVARWVLALLVLPFVSLWPLEAIAGLFCLQILVWLLLAYGTLIEPFRLQVTRVALHSAKLSNPGQPLRIAHLSDLHIERLTKRERALPSMVAELAPDLIVLTGDFLSTTYNDDPQALADLGKLLKQFDAPGGVYAVWGTIEVDLPPLLRPILADAGITVLEDQGVDLTVNDHAVWLMGVYPTRDPDSEGAILQKLLDNAPPGALTLLLYHVPDLMPQASSLGVDLVLAGHTHGGQWRLPGFGAVLTSSRYWKRYEAGAYREGETELYVSRGLGMEGFGTPRARFFCPPEVITITISGEPESRED